MAIEIQTFEDTPEKIDAETDVLNDALNSYTEPMQESQPVTDTPEPENPDSWLGNPAYYQSGKKRGQLRKSPSLRGSYNHAAETSIKGSLLINGALFLSIVNFIVPLLICTVNNWLNKKDKMTVKELQLDASEKKEIDPLMDATLKQLNITGNPLVLLSITLTAAYAMKFVNRKIIAPPVNE